MLEPIQGESGVHVLDEELLGAAREACDEHGAALIFDEIQTGMGRTGRLWGYEHSGVEPDVMTLAKALANGVPIGAMLCRESAASVLTAGSHGSTFGGTPFVTSVALATLTTLIGEKLPERAARLGRELMDSLRRLQASNPRIKDVRGRGLLIGIELDKPAAPVMDACRESGLLVLTAGEKVLRLAPPLVAQPTEIARALDILTDVLGKAAG
jgi:acetylornithine aminotransferase